MLNILTFAKNILLIRLVENNDWVVFVLLGAILVFIIVLQYLQRESGVKDFFLQPFVDSGNIFPSWLLISLVHIMLLSSLTAKFIPILPKEIAQLNLLGYSLNNFGFALLCFCAFYFIKFIFTFLFYSSIGQDKKWGKLYFVSSKFYFGASIVLIVTNYMAYFIPTDNLMLFQICLVLFGVAAVFKIFYFFFNRNSVLPNEWYYKFLYICTLQFAPLLALWKLLFP